ncbi:MAG: hypothetical protein AMS18_08265 [Gemmatimonas sp. SG8_17]|nr:MAG: hypothetical protein AMS18_08265 [Gemmatimonas sp. SG8_17]
MPVLRRHLPSPFSITALTESDLRSCIGLDDEALLAIEDGFTRLAQGGATVPPVMMIPVTERNGEIDGLVCGSIR